ncbi:MAG: DUF4340 domain-containing protein [Oscillospiraceae bacterium]|nr:DUF4340 domain-containing protein [Oscillospiraceae bacterium]
MSTKKMRILLVAMAAILGLSVGGYVLVDHNKKQAEQAEADKRSALNLCSFDTEQVTAVDICNPDGTFHAELANGEWVLTETDYPQTFPVNSFYLNSIVSSMSHLTAEQMFEKNPEIQSNCGLDTAPADGGRTEITCTAGGETYTVYIGNPSATKEYYYVSVPSTQADTVYGIKYDTGAAFCGGISYLHDPYLLHASETSITGFRMEHNGDVAYDLSTDTSGQWQLNAPVENVSINSVQVKTIVTELVRLQYSRFVSITEDKAELKQYGLDNTSYTLSIHAGDDNFTFLFPEFTENDSEIYVYCPETATIGTIHSRDTVYLTESWRNLLDKAVLRVPFAEASALDVTVDGKQFRLQIDHENSRYQLDDIDLSGLDSATNSNFEYLYASVSEIQAEDVAEEPQLPETPVPSCVFRYTLNDGTQRTLELVPIDELNYWAYVDGRCIGQTVRRNALSGSTGVLSFLEKITDNLADQDITYTPADAEQPETASAPEENTSPAESAAEESQDEREDESL